MGYKHENSKGKSYFLHTCLAKNGKTSLYFFAKDERDNHCDLPEIYEVGENPRTGLPFVRKKK